MISKNEVKELIDCDIRYKKYLRWLLFLGGYCVKI